MIVDIIALVVHVADVYMVVPTSQLMGDDATNNVQLIVGKVVREGHYRFGVIPMLVTVKFSNPYVYVLALMFVPVYTVVKLQPQSAF